MNINIFWQLKKQTHTFYLVFFLKKKFLVNCLCNLPKNRWRFFWIKNRIKKWIFAYGLANAKDIFLHKFFICLLYEFLFFFIRSTFFLQTMQTYKSKINAHTQSAFLMENKIQFNRKKIISSHIISSHLISVTMSIYFVFFTSEFLERHVCSSRAHDCQFDSTLHL